MAVLTFEGIVEAGQIRLLNGEHLPDKTNVYVVVPNVAPETEASEVKPEKPFYSVTLPSNPRILSPRLSNRDDAPHFVVEVSK